MPKVFISYRRSDTQMVAGRLRESLARRLGNAAIFRDKDSIGAGEDWTKAIEASLSGDVVVLALIGPGWETARDEAGGRRLMIQQTGIASNSNRCSRDPAGSFRCWSTAPRCPGRLSWHCQLNRPPLYSLSPVWHTRPRIAAPSRGRALSSSR
jgi:hypothetical protein